MKKYFVFLTFITLIISSCANGKSIDDSRIGLIISDGTTRKEYKVEDLELLESIEADFNYVIYVGVPTQLLFKDTRFDISNLKAIKAIASNGYSGNYGPELFFCDDVVVAYKSKDGEMNEEDEMFRMVLPGEEGKLNIRNLIVLQAIP